MEYRKWKGYFSDTWHFNIECQHWGALTRASENSVEVRQEKPTTGELCNECRGKAKQAKRAEKARG